MKELLRREGEGRGPERRREGGGERTGEEEERGEEVDEKGMEGKRRSREERREQGGQTKQRASKYEVDAAPSHLQECSVNVQFRGCTGGGHCCCISREPLLGEESMTVVHCPAPYSSKVG